MKFFTYYFQDKGYLRAIYFDYFYFKKKQLKRDRLLKAIKLSLKAFRNSPVAFPCKGLMVFPIFQIYVSYKLCLLFQN